MADGTVIRLSPKNPPQFESKNGVYVDMPLCLRTTNCRGLCVCVWRFGYGEQKKWDPTQHKTTGRSKKKARLCMHWIVRASSTRACLPALMLTDHRALDRLAAEESSCVMPDWTKTENQSNPNWTNFNCVSVKWLQNRSFDSERMMSSCMIDDRAAYKITIDIKYMHIFASNLMSSESSHFHLGFALLAAFTAVAARFYSDILCIHLEFRTVVSPIMG